MWQKRLMYIRLGQCVCRIRIKLVFLNKRSWRLWVSGSIWTVSELQAPGLQFLKFESHTLKFQAGGIVWGLGILGGSQ